MNYENINIKVSLEEIGRFTAIDDKKSKVTGMLALRRMKNAGIDPVPHLEELRKLDNDYRSYVRAGNSDNNIIYQKRLAVVNKIIELEKILKTIN